MNTFLLVMAAVILATVALGVIRVIRGPSRSDRAVAVQLLATGGMAAILLGGSAVGSQGAIDTSLILAVLAPFLMTAVSRERRTRHRGTAERTPGSQRVEPGAEARVHGGGA
ncbi:MAG: hypothetical protein KF724_11285 [Phycisphaeraceae bacterium]|nr:hypothetical protein [Phycisphaeraceae bacterium]